MIRWMNTLIPQIKALGYVDKIFWNHGEGVGLFSFLCGQDTMKREVELLGWDGSGNPR